jgi:hypothetical protein
MSFSAGHILHNHHGHRQHLPKHSSSELFPASHQPRAATRPTHAAHAVTDVTISHTRSALLPDTRYTPATPPSLDRSPPPTAVKVDSRPRTVASTVKSRAHSRLASLGRIRSRGSVFQHSPAERPSPAVPSSPAETLTTKHLPVSPSLASSHKRSEASTLSNTSSETVLSDDAKSDIKSLDERQTPPGFYAEQKNASCEYLLKSSEDCDPEEQYRRLIHGRPRMMHQTSSRLLRMTEDERPFTRVCITNSSHVLPFIPMLWFSLSHVGRTDTDERSP